MSVDDSDVFTIIVIAGASVSYQSGNFSKIRVNAVIAREPKRPRQSPNQIAALPPAPRNDICFNRM